MDILRKKGDSHWKNILNTESDNGTWDWTYVNNLEGSEAPKYIRLSKFNDDIHWEGELTMNEEEWEDLINLIKRIS